MAGRLANRSKAAPEPLKIRIKKNDMVKVIAGRDKGKTGRVLEVDRGTGRLLVEGVMLSKKHVRPNPARRSRAASRSASPDPRLQRDDLTSDGKTSRIGTKVETVGGKVRRVRIARKTGEVLDKK